MAVIVGCGGDGGNKASTTVKQPAQADSGFVGSKSCAECHSEEEKEWIGSDHHLAMQEATEETVLGNFDDVRFEHFGVESHFRKKGGEFFVTTPNEDGVPTEYKIDYTFGHYPLQQYLIPFPGGRYQALSICWDSRPKEEGGQRWYHLYPDEKVPHDDILHWTGQHFNWNYMCADCHSTDLKKGYDLATKSYHTTWSEMNVSCEACHGPGAEHVKWAKSPDDYTGKLSKFRGLEVVLKEPNESVWAIDPKTLKPKRTKPLESNIQVETCARCHAHRRILEEEFTHGQRFFDTHRAAILDDVLYHPDGQINEEVYVYGSFIQSKMFHNDVRCTDCHNPHTLKLRAPGNLLCAQCHTSTKYDTPKHHHHQVGSTGAKCVECHMPEKHYMGVDPRRDHSLRIPRPDLSVKLGTPNACNQCHDDKDAPWAADALAKWLKEDGKPPLPPHYGEAIAAGRAGDAAATPKLLDLAGDANKPAIVRATALGLLARRPDQESVTAIVMALRDPDPTVREAAVLGLELLPPPQRAQVGAELLGDPIRMIRIEAARILAPAHADLTGEAEIVYPPQLEGLPIEMESPHAENFKKALGEYKESLDALADRPGSHMGYGLLYTDLGDLEKAEQSYREAFSVDPTHVQSRINLADMLYRQGRIEEAGKLLTDSVRLAPEIGFTHEALGRHLIREKDYEGGLVSLAEAVRLMPDQPHIHYFYGVALNQLEQFDKALPVLQRAHELAPQNPEYLTGIASICRDHGKWELALKYAKQVVALDPNYTQFYQTIQAQARAAGVDSP